MGRSVIKLTYNCFLVKQGKHFIHAPEYYNQALLHNFNNNIMTYSPGKQTNILSVGIYAISI